MITKATKQKAESQILNYNGRYSERIEFNKNYGKLVTFAPNKKTGIYNWFPYKEAFSNILVYKLIELFELNSGDYLLDPFCGIGTTLLAAKEKGINAYGIDILPLCTFVTQVKINVCNYDTGKMREYLDQILDSDLVIDRSLVLPDIKIITKAFDSSDGFLEILSFKRLIENVVEDQLYRNLFTLGLLSIVGELSNTRKDGAFLRLVQHKQHKDTKSLFRAQIAKYILDVDKLSSGLFENDLLRSNVDNKVFCMDSRGIELDRCFHAVITSPPYLNRYDYTRTYTLELATEFVNSFQELKTIRYNTIRSHVEAKFGKSQFVKSAILRECLTTLSNRQLNNPQIPEMISGYFEDMYLVLRTIKRYLYVNGKVAFVVGTVRYSGVNIPVDIILADIGSQLGFKLEKIIITRVKGNSQQQRRQYDDDPTRESIVILSMPQDSLNTSTSR